MVPKNHSHPLQPVFASGPRPTLRPKTLIRLVGRCQGPSLGAKDAAKKDVDASGCLRYSLDLLFAPGPTNHHPKSSKHIEAGEILVGGVLQDACKSLRDTKTP